MNEGTNDNPMDKVQDYIGTKLIKAVPLSRGDYNKHRGWEIPANEDPQDEGYLVVYPKDHQPNGEPYVSWSPKAVFESAYRRMNNLMFGDALMLMKLGHKLARAGWNGKDMWVIYVPGSLEVPLIEGTIYANHHPDKGVIEILPHFDMWTINAAGRRAMLPGWLASQSDMDANDWCVVQ
jgi:hypothetical protein